MKTVLVALLVLAMAFAGCSGKAPGATEDDGDDDQRTSDGGDRQSDAGNNTDPPHETVTLLDTPVSLVGQASQTFDVQVPDNVTIVDFMISSDAPATEFGGLRMELEGCGVYDMGAGASRGSVGGTATLGERLCKDAAGGAHKLTVSNLGYVDGNLRLTGQIPKSNETAAP